MESFNKLLQKVTSLTVEAEKCQLGNKSAGTRLRAGMHEVKSLAQGVREEVLALATQGGDNGK
jgi:hypothetical protein